MAIAGQNSAYGYEFPRKFVAVVKSAKMGEGYKIDRGIGFIGRHIMVPVNLGGYMCFPAGVYREVIGFSLAIM